MRWHGAYVASLIFVTWVLHLGPVAAGLFVGIGNFVAAALFTSKVERKSVVVWTISSIAIGVFIALWRP